MKYRVYYYIGIEKVERVVEADNLFYLAITLESEILYKEQFNSIYKIELIDGEE